MPQLLIHSEAGETSSLSLFDEVVSIGRRRDNALCLPHLSVSGHHARITGENDCYIIEDLRSTNGTQINGQNIERQVLVHQDDLTIGSYKISYSETNTVPKRIPGTENITAITSMEPIIDPSLAAREDVAVIRVTSGNKAGSVVTLQKPVTTVGKTGAGMGAISKKSTGYYLLPVTGHQRPIKHNGRGLTPQVEVKLVGGDMLEIAGEHVEFVHPYYSS